LYGTAVTISAEIKQFGSCSSLSWLKSAFSDKKDETKSFVSKMLAEIDIKALTPNNLILIANLLHSYNTKGYSYKHQLRQIRGYKWVESAKFNQAVDRLIKQVGPDGIYEHQVKYEHPLMLITGLADIVQPNGLWEIKMTKHTTVEQRIQLCIYASMLPIRPLYLYNPGMDRKWEVKLNKPDQFMDKLIRNRLRTNTNMTPESFMSMINESVDLYREPEPIANGDELDAYD
jgi:hypothetical protein